MGFYATTSGNEIAAILPLMANPPSFHSTNYGEAACIVGLWLAGSAYPRSSRVTTQFKGQIEGKEQYLLQCLFDSFREQGYTGSMEDFLQLWRKNYIKCSKSVVPPEETKPGFKVPE